MQCNTSVITQWVSDMSTFIKSIDPRHMARPPSFSTVADFQVTFGSEGFLNWPGRTEQEYNGLTGLDFEAQVALPNVDFGTVHLYPYV